MKLSNAPKSIDGLRDLIVKDQFINSCPKELVIHLCERALETLQQRKEETHGKDIFSGGRSKPPAQHEKDDTKKLRIESSPQHCYKLKPPTVASYLSHVSCVECTGMKHRTAE